MARAKSATVDLKVRMKEPLRAKIEAAARARGVSLNAEAVDRLEWSFVEEDFRFEDFGGPGGYGIFRVLGSAAAVLGGSQGHLHWWLDPSVFAKVRRLCSHLLKTLQEAIADGERPTSGDTLTCRITIELSSPTIRVGDEVHPLKATQVSTIRL